MRGGLNYCRTSYWVVGYVTASRKQMLRISLNEGRVELLSDKLLGGWLMASRLVSMAVGRLASCSRSVSDLPRPGRRWRERAPAAVCSSRRLAGTAAR